MFIYSVFSIASLMIHIYSNINAYVCKQTYIRTYIQTCIRTYIYTYIHTHIPKYIYTYRTVYTHININTCTYIRIFLNFQIYDAFTFIRMEVNKHT